MTQIDQNLEQEAAPYRALRESLVRLSQVEPGLICPAIKDGQPEVFTIPPRNMSETFRSDCVPNWQDFTIAITDTDIRFLKITPRSHPSTDPVFSGYDRVVYEPPSDYFQPDENGVIRTEDEIIEAFSTRVGKTRGGKLEVESLVLHYPPNIIEENSMRNLLKALYWRYLINSPVSYSERSRHPHSQESQRYEALKTAFDHKTYIPGEDLAARFNALVEKLSPIEEGN